MGRHGTQALARTGLLTQTHTILAFSADRNYWGRQSRRTQTTQTGADGSFVLRYLPPGDYFIAALTDIGVDDIADATRLESIAAVAARVHLDPGEKKVQQFKIGSPAP